jgi:hypothetical protein
MKKIITYTLLACLTFPLISKAEDMVLPVISKPAILEEGTQRELTAAQIAELLPWAKDSKNFLTDLLDNVQGLTMTDRVDRLVEGIKSVVAQSAPKNSEMFMRYALNRALVISNTIDHEMSADSVGFIDAKSRVLTMSIKLALKYYDTDIAKLNNNKTSSPYAAFGVEYFTFLTELNKSIFDASTQYNIQRTSLEWLQWDMYRDLNNASFAASIIKINNALRTFPLAKLNDAQSISYIRQMKKVSEQLNVLPKRVESTNTVVTTKTDNYADAHSGKYKSSGSSCFAMSTSRDYLKEVQWTSCFADKYKSSDSESGQII